MQKETTFELERTEEEIRERLRRWWTENS